MFSAADHLSQDRYYIVGGKGSCASEKQIETGSCQWFSTMGCSSPLTIAAGSDWQTGICKVFNWQTSKLPTLKNVKRKDCE